MEEEDNPDLLNINDEINRKMDWVSNAQNWVRLSDIVSLSLLWIYVVATL